MKLLKGKPVAQMILDRLKSDISSRAKKPGLAVILVGNDAASEMYVNLKEKTAQKIGMNFFRFDFLENISEEDVLACISKLNNDESVNGIIVQLPLPEKFNTQKIIENIDPKKDADGFHPANSRRLLNGEATAWPVFPRAITKLIESSEEELSAKMAVVIANSHDFGKIMCAMLEREQVTAEYILFENMSSNLGKIKAADIVVSAVGSPGLLNGQMLKDGAIVIDGGISKVEERVVGDVNLASTEPLSGHITPVPGGVGPVTIACLLENTYLAFLAQKKNENN